MMDTPEQSAELKSRFKAWFNDNGYDSVMPEKLNQLADKYPLEYIEACHEWEAEHPDELDEEEIEGS